MNIRPVLFFGPIEKHASEEFGRWAAANDWNSFKAQFASRANDIESGQVGGFTLVAHNAIKFVIDPLVASHTLTPTAKDEFEAICNNVAAKVEEAKTQAAANVAAAEAKKKAGAATGSATAEEARMIEVFAKVNATVGAIINSIAYPKIATALQERWQLLIDESTGLKDYELEDFFKVLAKMGDAKIGETTSERQDFLHSLLKTEGHDERLKMALAHTPKI